MPNKPLIVAVGGTLRPNSMPYFTDKPVGCVATGFGWQCCNATLQGLRAIVHALRGWPTPIGIALNTKTPSFDETGACINQELAAQIRIMVDQLLAQTRLNAASLVSTTGRDGLALPFRIMKPFVFPDATRMLCSHSASVAGACSHQAGRMSKRASGNSNPGKIRQ